MARILETTVYKFDELSDQAKERARAWFRDGQLDYDWYESVFTDADEIAGMLGIEIDRKPRNNPKATAEPAILFSGFYSQGDGACFEGRYSFSADAGKRLREHAPKDETLHAIADSLDAVQADNDGALEATVKHRGRYYHAMSTEIDVDMPGEADSREMTTNAEEIIKEALRDFMRWIYRALEKECEWLQADEQVDESIGANEYEFTEEGKIV